MAVWTVLLGLSLLCGVPAFKSQLTSPSIPFSFENKPGPLYNIPLNGFPGVTYPVTQFVLRHWIFILGIDIISSNVLHIEPNMGVYFEESGGLTVFNDAVRGTHPNAGYLRLGTWMMVLYGTQVAGTSFGAFALRDVSYMYVTISATSTLPTTAIYHGSNDANWFTVRGYTGLHCGCHN